MTDINILFCRSFLKGIHAQVRKHFPGTKVSEAAVLHSGFRGQWLFEYMERIGDGKRKRWSVYVNADNAYEARSEGWMKYMADKGVKEWQ